ncbi:MAG: hypothetical protein ACI9AF_000540 [Granulosicoccus sp.]
MEEGRGGCLADFAARVVEGGLEEGFVSRLRDALGLLDDGEAEGGVVGFPSGLDGGEGFLRVVEAGFAEPVESFVGGADFPGVIGGFRR